MESRPAGHIVEGPTDGAEKLDRIVSSVPSPIVFAGHYHMWLLARPDSIDSWAGDRPVSLANGRFFVTVGALCEGRFATFDSEMSEFVPFNLGRDRNQPTTGSDSILMRAVRPTAARTPK